MNIQIALNSRSYILDLDNVLLPLGTFFKPFDGVFIKPAYTIDLNILSKTFNKKLHIECFTNFTCGNGFNQKL